MAPALPLSPALEEQLRAWLAEDIGRGDLTAPALEGRRGAAVWVARRAGVFCGGPLAAQLFRILDPQMEVELPVADGSPVAADQTVLRLQGLATALVAGERTALNLAMRLSGIATATAALVARLEGSGVQLADTRKTTPGLRALEKYAVRCGGGMNHRMSLSDAALVKDNHVVAASTTAWVSTMPPCSRRTTWPGVAVWRRRLRQCAPRHPGRPGSSSRPNPRPKPRRRCEPVPMGSCWTNSRQPRSGFWCRVCAS